MRYIIDKPFGSYRGIEFSIESDEIERSYIDDQLSFFRSAIENGVQFSEGVGELTIGWVTADLVKTSESYLRIQEPDFTSFPIKTVNRLDNTLRHFKRQAELAEQLGLLKHLAFPTIEESCLVCTRYDEDPELVMERFEPSAPVDSGWYIGCNSSGHNHDDPSNLRRVSLYEAYLKSPSITNYVALPVGVKLLLGGGQLMIASFKGDQLHLT